jgi:Kef-type K+ transport system membrane component KefB
VNEQQSRGQVTERVLHLAVLNSIMAVFAFKIVVGVTMFKTLGAFWLALYDSVIVLSTSAALGALFGIGVPALLRAMRANHLDNTPAFALAIVVLVTFTHGLNLSPILAALIFGLVTRHRRITFNASQRGFGTLGDLLSVLLFVFIATSFKWRIVFAGIQLGLALIAVRFLAKTIGITCFAHLSGITWKKGLLISLAMTPMSAFVILLFEQTPHLGINFFEQLAPLATAALTMEILSPILMQCSLRWAKETRN